MSTLNDAANDRVVSPAIQCSDGKIASACRVRPNLGCTLEHGSAVGLCQLTVVCTPPLMPVKVSPPEGTVVTPGTVVIFAWDTTFQAETYDFHIFNAQTSAIDQYMLTGLKPAEICSGDTCSISLKLSLPDSERHAWRVRALNNAGQSAWTRSIFTFSSKGAQ